MSWPLVALTSDLLRPTAWPVYKNTGESATENKQVLKEPMPRWRPNAEAALTSGTPVAAAVQLPAGLVISGVVWLVSAAEATPANRTHLWATLLNSAGKVLAKSADYTSSTNTAMGTNTRRGLLFEATYEVTETGVFYVMVNETMSSTAPMKVECAALAGGMVGAPPVLCGTGPAGQTTPPEIGATLAVTEGANYPYLALV